MGTISATFAVWRLGTIVVTEGGQESMDLTWDAPKDTLLSLCEIYVATLSASIPYFWPLITKHFDKILVSYEFKVSSEPRYHDDDVELGPTAAGAWQSGSNLTGDKEVARSLESREHKPEHYGDDHVQDQVNPFRAQFGTEAGSQTASLTGQKKGGFIRFLNAK